MTVKEALWKYLEYTYSYNSFVDSNKFIPSILITGCILVYFIYKIETWHGEGDLDDLGCSGWFAVVCGCVFLWLLWPIIIPIIVLYEVIAAVVWGIKENRLAVQRSREEELKQQQARELERRNEEALEAAKAEQERRELAGRIFVDKILDAYLLIDSNIWMTQHYAEAFDKLLEYGEGKTISIPKVQFDEIENKKDREKMSPGGRSARFALSVLEKYQVEGFGLFDIGIEADKHAYADRDFIKMMQDYTGDKHKIFIAEDRTLRMRMRSECPDVEVIEGNEFFHELTGEYPVKPAPVRTYSSSGNSRHFQRPHGRRKRW